MTDPRICPHEQTQPVEVRSHTTGGTEVVARICTDCLTQLPAAWGCTGCEWVDERAMCNPVPRPLLARSCKEHA